MEKKDQLDGALDWLFRLQNDRRPLPAICRAYAIGRAAFESSTTYAKGIDAQIWPASQLLKNNEVGIWSGEGAVAHIAIRPIDLKFHAPCASFGCEKGRHKGLTRDLRNHCSTAP
jgi:hypothetical protein